MAEASVAEALPSEGQPEKRVKRHYPLTFQYIQNIKSPWKYLSTLRGQGVSFNKEEIVQKKGNNPFKNLSTVFEIDVIGEHGSSGDMEKTLLRSWCTWSKENEIFGWVSIKPPHLSYLEDRTKPVTKIKDAKFCVGAFKSPTQFCKHFNELHCNVVFEYDTDSLIIQGSIGDEIGLRFELYTKTFLNSAIVCVREQELSIFIESDERFKVSLLMGDNIVARTNFDRFHIKLRKDFGLSTVFQISFHDETLDVGLEIIAYLKRRGITVVYGDTQLTESCYTLDKLNQTITFNDFETEYAWQCLLHRGYKVIDSIDENVIEIVKRNRNPNLAELFFEMETLVDNNIFFDFEHNWREASKPKADENEEQDSRLSDNPHTRRIVVTPTSEIYFKKEPTKQNRVLLQHNVDFFLRVVFRDEDFKKLQLLSQEPVIGRIIDRVKQFLKDGIRIGDRHFKFLGCSNSQMREHGAWFVAEHGGNTAESIRKSLGDFTKERCVASYVSRLGLCFSSSWKTVNVDQCELIADVEKNGYCFTDGIGMMSESLAKKISSALQVPKPSAFQIRYAGCKGVIALNPDLGQEERLVVRDSMLKFESPSKTLEILKWTRPGQLFLNRQVITLMSGLGVPDEAFLSLQQKVLLDLATMLIDEDRAFDELSKVLKNIQYKNIRKNGVRLTKDPFFRSILVTIYKYRVDGILKKSRIPIPWSQGRIMMGTVDETGKLNYGEVFILYSNTDEASKCKSVVHTGTVVVAKNPCFHPGDLRKFKAVDIPDLHHMVDCIVFPQKGERPHPDEMSGSDLDGDMYFVCWDQSFIPPNANEPPMKFPKSAKMELHREIRVGDVVDFLGDYIKNDRLGVIANAHVVHADMDSIYSLACLQLAKMHSDAVDFPKTGQIPEMSKDLSVEKYPDFMMKKDKPVYTSQKILGKLFRQCEFVSKTINRSRHIELVIENAIENPDLLQHGYQFFLEEAQSVLNVYYKKISDLMSQYGIKTEAELFTGMLLSMKTQRGCLENERFEIAELIQTKLSKICRATRNEFFREFDGEQNAKGNPKLVYEKASAWYMASYGSNGRCLSFPWLVGDFIISKTRQLERKDFEVSGYLEIGSTVEKHVNRRSSKRNDLFDDMIRYIKYIGKTNPNILHMPLVGIVPLRLLDDDLKTISFYTGNSGTEHNFSVPLYNFAIQTVSDSDVLRKTSFIRWLLDRDSKMFYLLSYLLDWARDRNMFKLAVKDGLDASMQDELDFAYDAANIINSDKDLPVPALDPENLSVLNIKRTKDNWLNQEEKYTLGRDIVRFFKEYLNHITNQNKDTNVPMITEEVMNVFLDLSLNGSLESLEYENYEEIKLYLPLEIWNHLLSAKEYVAQKLQEKMGLPYVNIAMSRDRLLILHACGPYDKLKHIQRSLNKIAQNHSLFINTPTRDMVVIKNSAIFTFEGCSGKGDVLEYTPYKGDCNTQHTKWTLAIPCLRRMRMHVRPYDCKMFLEACMKQIESASRVYDQIFHGEMLMSIVLGRFYLLNAPDGPTNIQTFERKLLKQTEENEKLMNSGKGFRYKGKKMQQKQKHLIKKSFKAINFDVNRILQFLTANGFELQRLKKSDKIRLNLDTSVNGKRRNCVVSLDENLKFQHVTFDSLSWVVADVIREKCESESIADIRFKLLSKRKLSKESARKVNDFYELAEKGDYMFEKIHRDSVIITKDFAHKIHYVQEKIEYFLHAPDPEYRKFDIRLVSFVEYTNIDKNNGRIFQDVERRNEISITPVLPDLSRHDQWKSLLRELWEFSFHLSSVLDSI